MEDEAGASRTVHFLVKREDMTSERYGGNKVRTLQHQLAVYEAIATRSEQPVPLGVTGSWGSNQMVATVVHALGLPGSFQVDATYMTAE